MTLKILQNCNQKWIYNNTAGVESQTFTPALKIVHKYASGASDILHAW